jgi:hypothetical protein
MAQTPISSASFASLQQAPAGLQKVNLAASPARPASEAPSIKIDERLLSGPEGILVTGGRFGAAAPADGNDARSRARAAQQELAAQSHGIANRQPHIVSRLFH